MRYVPKLPTTNDNVPQSSPVREFFLLLGGLAIVVTVTFFLLAVSADLIVAHLPETFEQRLSTWIAESHAKHEKQAGLHRDTREEKLQRIADKLAAAGNLHGWKFRVTVLDADKVENAFAFPGGLIGVTSGLVNNAQSENELAEVLGHEIGHTVKRHIMRGLGRTLLFGALSSWIFGDMDKFPELVAPFVTVTDLKFDRKQEEEADEVGLALVNAAYGHVGGTLSFFERNAGTEEEEGILQDTRVGEYFRTHPLSRNRVERLKQIIRERNYRVGETVPFR